MTINNAMNVSSSGLSAERFRMDVIAANIANANSTQVGNQEPYRRKDVVLSSGPDGVQVSGVEDDQTPFVQKYDPGNPNADINGYVKGSNVQPINEMVDMMSASRAYEANVAAFNTEKGMVKAALSIGKV
ncbi:MAG TPA: flagellar basal body rod protein FlgC [Fimbriimonas sp.]|nr:flagellar basal body rod protein FlgC [Fimbriimonas sp.]